MNRIRSLLLTVVGLFGVLMALGGCATCQRCCVISGPVYSQVVLTDVEGCWISEYIAEGPVRETCEGVCFQAVQRRIFKPTTLTFKYPLGRPVAVRGSHILVTPTGKPSWLQVSDGDAAR